MGGYALIGYMPLMSTYLIYDMKGDQFQILTEQDLMVYINAGKMWNVGIENNKITPIKISLDRFKVDNNINSFVAVKELIDADTKKAVAYEIIGSNYSKHFIRVNDILAGAKELQKINKKVQIANLKVICPDKRSPYIVKIGPEIPKGYVNNKTEKIQSQIYSILAYNITGGYVEDFNTNNEELNRKHNLQGIESLVNELEANGITYNHTEAIKKALAYLKERGVQVFSWSEKNNEGKVVIRQLSATKEKMMINMSKRLETLQSQGKNFEELKKRFEFVTVFKF